MKQKGLTKKLLTLGAGILLSGFILIGSLFVYYSFTLPNPNELVNRNIPESTKIYDRNGELLYEVFADAKRELVKIESIPDHVKQATIAIEDKDFYNHGGIDLSGIARAVFKNLLSGDPTGQGGSTITQQFVKNAVLTRDKSYIRKIKEAILAIELERQYSKDEILQLYLNEIPYGQNAFGIQAASQSFFGKNAQDLTVAEAAYLAALPKAPSYFSPYGPNRDQLDARADTVIKLMADQGYITTKEKETAQRTEVEFRTIDRGIKAPHFSLYIQQLLAEKYGETGLREGGFKITTSLDIKLQEKAETAVANHVEKNEKNYNAHNASLVAIDPKTGQILAMVGSRDYFDEKNDGAVNVALRPRQPGSSFKPYVYATAFKEGMSPATMLMDVVTNFGAYGGSDYIPQNFNFKEYGPVSIRQALQGSLNIPAVKTMILVGISDAIDTAEDMGITTLKDRSRFGPSLVLGGGEVKLLDHVSAFGVFANGGIRHEPVAILKIEDHNGKVLEEYKPRSGKEVLDPQVAYQINHVLSDNDSRAYIFGASNNLSLPGRQIAAKTGTTQESKDAWTLGYTPSLTAGVWVGNNQPSPMRGGGSMAAAPIWNEFMKNALEGTPNEEFPRPEGIVFTEVDKLSGKLPTQYSPSTKTEVFASFNIPEKEDDIHVPVEINGATQIFTILHSEMPENEAWEEPVRRWATSNGYPYPPEGANIQKEDDSIEFQINAPSTVSSLPWEISIKASGKNKIIKIELFLDGRLISESPTDNLSFIGSLSHVNGLHRLTIQATNSDGGVNSIARNIRFDTGNKILLLAPSDNQIVNLPANIITESSIDVAPENVQFFARSASGNTVNLRGIVRKQQVSDIFHYTLNWSDENSVDIGSHSIYAEIQDQKTQEHNIKIQN